MARFQTLGLFCVQKEPLEVKRVIPAVCCIALIEVAALVGIYALTQVASPTPAPPAHIQTTVHNERVLTISRDYQREPRRPAPAAATGEKTVTPGEARHAAGAGPEEPTRTPWDELAACESNGHWHLDSGDGYYGGLQFDLETWRTVGGDGYPHEASRLEQISLAQRVVQLRIRWGMDPWAAWPTCSQEVGL